MSERQSGHDEQSASVRAGLGRRYERSEFGRSPQVEGEAGRPAFVVGVGGGAQARWVHGFAAKIGDVPLIGDLLVFDLRQINPGAARGIDGLLGQDFFRGRIVQIDFRKKRLRFLERADSAAAKRGLPIESWRDVDFADKTARRDAGLDSEEGSRIQIGLALIETSLQAINLPKDALPE